MWCIRVLNGPHAGKILPLQSGANKIGRAPSCNVTISHPSISKEHAQVDVLGDKIIITDLKSRNGTFVNGVQIRSQSVQPGDKIALFDIIVEVVSGGSNVRPINSKKSSRPSDVYEQALQAYQGNAAPAANYNPQSDSASPQSAAPSNAADYVVGYFENVIMPGIYRLTEWMEYKTLILIFCLINVVVVTSLSTIPLTMILKSRIEKTSQQRARSLARSLALSNQSAIQQGLTTGVNINMVANEPGVSEAYIINNEGYILSPPSMVGRAPDEPFVHMARKTGSENVEQLSTEKIGALVPIIGQNMQTGLSAPLAHAVIIYDMSVFAVDDGQTFSLFVKSLAIALVIGGIIFFLLYRSTLYPVALMNRQVSDSLRTGEGQVFIKFNFPELQELIGNVNSALARTSGAGPGQDMSSFEYDRSHEVTGVLNLVGFAAVAIRPEDRRVLGFNSHFADQIGKGFDWSNITVNEILDNSLKQNLLGLIDRAAATPEQMAADSIDVHSINYDIQAQAVYGNKAVSYIIVAFVPRMEG
jgi:hypothetical protein